MLVALLKQVQAGPRVTVPARVEEIRPRRFRVRPAKEPSAASLDPLALLVRCDSRRGARSLFCNHRA